MFSLDAIGGGSLLIVITAQGRLSGATSFTRTRVQMPSNRIKNEDVKEGKKEGRKEGRKEERKEKRKKGRKNGRIASARRTTRVSSRGQSQPPSTPNVLTLGSRNAAVRDAAYDGRQGSAVIAAYFPRVDPHPCPVMRHELVSRAHDRANATSLDIVLSVRFIGLGKPHTYNI